MVVQSNTRTAKTSFLLCHHQLKFDLGASWSFFATSRRKSCKGIGETEKRIITRESLQCNLGSSITSVENVYEFCKPRVDKISFFIAKKEHLSSIQQQLETRWCHAKAITGMCILHCFIPVSTNVIAAKNISFDTSFTSIHNFSRKSICEQTMAQICTNSYVAYL
jgi:hypothetical protein